MPMNTRLIERCCAAEREEVKRTSKKISGNNTNKQNQQNKQTKSHPMSRGASTAAPESNNSRTTGAMPFCAASDKREVRKAKKAKKAKR